jgi:hypothetical protein
MAGEGSCNLAEGPDFSQSLAYMKCSVCHPILICPARSNFLVLSHDAIWHGQTKKFMCDVYFEYIHVNFVHYCIRLWLVLSTLIFSLSWSFLDAKFRSQGFGRLVFITSKFLSGIFHFPRLKPFSRSVICYWDFCQVRPVSSDNVFPWQYSLCRPRLTSFSFFLKSPICYWDFCQVRPVSSDNVFPWQYSLCRPRLTSFSFFWDLPWHGEY